MLAAALAAYVMVKFFGVIFLGQPREAALARRARCRGAGAHRAASGSRWGASRSGLFPTHVIGALRPSCEQLGAALAAGARRRPGGCSRRSRDGSVSYSPLIFFLAIATIVIADACSPCGSSTTARARVRRRGTAASAS